MLRIVLSNADAVVKPLYRLLSREREVLLVSESEILLPDMPPDLLLYSAATLPECDGEVIYLLGHGRPPVAGGRLQNPRAVAVVNSQDEAGLTFAARHCLHTLTCGLSEKDTLTLSSMKEGSAVIALQRELRTIGQGLIEPVEIPVKYTTPMDRFSLLSLAAVVLLSVGEGPLHHLQLP